MTGEPLMLAALAVAVYVLVLCVHALRHKAGSAPFYALLGGITAVMSWVTDAGFTVEFGGLTLMIGSAVFYTSLLLGVFVVYVFDGPAPTRAVILSVAGVSALTPLVAFLLHAQAQMGGAELAASVPQPSLRVNTASVVTTAADLVLLAMAWEYLGKARRHIRLGMRAFLTLLGVMWVDVLLFTTGAFAGTPQYLGIMGGTLASRLAAGEIDLMPDVALMDLALPVMDGFAALAAIREDESLRDIPVVAVTASAMKGDRESILARGFDGYLAKPIDAEMLKNCMYALLER